MSKRKNENAYPSDTKRFSVPLPDFSVPPPGFTSLPYNSQNYQPNWFGSPTTQQPYGFYNYNSTETSPNFTTHNTNFAWSGNKHRNFQNGQLGRQTSSTTPKARGRGGRGRGAGRLTEPFNSAKSPRSTSSSGSTWFPAVPNSQYTLRNPSNSYSGDQTGSQTEMNDEKSEVKKTIVNKKGKRKSMSQKYSSKPWDLESAEKAMAAELEYNRLQNTQSLILKFPDAELNKDIVKTFSNSIEHVHFQRPSTPRYCFVQLCEGADVEEVKNQLKEVTFGGGKISVERKTNQKPSELSPEKIDPYTLYVGNLPTNITAETVKAIYPTAFRVDIGYAQKLKYTRYAFISYQSAEAALKAFKETHCLSLDSRSIIVRFRRHKGAVGMPGQSKTAGDQAEDAASSSRLSSASLELKNKKPSHSTLSEDDDVISVEINDGPVENDEDDYDYLYDEDLDDHMYNSDFDDSIFDNLDSLGRECSMVNERLNNSKVTAAPAAATTSKQSKSRPTSDRGGPSKTTVSKSASKPLPKCLEPIARSRAVSNDKTEEQRFAEDLAALRDCILPPVRIKQEPPERDELDDYLETNITDFREMISTIKREPIEDHGRQQRRHLDDGEVPMPIMSTERIKQEPVESPADTTTTAVAAAAAAAVAAVPLPTSVTLPLPIKTEQPEEAAAGALPEPPAVPVVAENDDIRSVAVCSVAPRVATEDFDISHLMTYMTQENSAFEALQAKEKNVEVVIPSKPVKQARKLEEELDFSEAEEDDTDYAALLGAPPANLEDYINMA